MSDGAIQITIDPNSIKSIKAARDNLNKLGHELGWNKEQLDMTKKSLDLFIGSMAKANTSSPFTKLTKDTKSAKIAFEELTRASVKMQNSMSGAMSDKGFLDSARSAKALLVIEQQLNAESEKQARIVAKLAAEGKGGTEQKNAAKTLNSLKAQTAALEKNLAVQKQINRLTAAGVGNTSPQALSFNSWATTTAKATTKTKELDSANTAVAKSTKSVQIAMAGMARSVGVATLSYSALLPLMAGMAAGATIKKVYSLGAAFEYTTTYVDALSGAIGDLNASSIQSSLLDLNGLRSGPGELALGMKEFAKAGEEASSSIEQIAEMSRFATVAEIDMAQATKLVIGQSRAYGTSFSESANMIAAAALSSATDIQELGNALSYTTELAEVTGTSFDEVATAMAIMANSGIVASKAGTAIRTSVLKMATPTDSLRKKLDALGISWSAFSDDGKIKNMKTMFTELNRVTKALPDEKRVGILKDLFGLRALKGGANLLKAQGEEWDSLNQKIRDAGENVDFISGIYGDLSDTAVAKWERLGVEVEKSLLKAFSSDEVKTAIDSMIDIVSSDATIDNITAIVDSLNTIGTSLTALISLATSIPGDLVDAGLVGYLMFGKAGVTRYLSAGLLIDKQMNDLQKAANSDDPDKGWFAAKLKQVQDWERSIIAEVEGTTTELDGAFSPDFTTETTHLGFDPPEINPDGYKLKFPVEGVYSDVESFNAKEFYAMAGESITSDSTALHLAETKRQQEEYKALMADVEKLRVAAQNNTFTPSIPIDPTAHLPGFDKYREHQAKLIENNKKLQESIDSINFKNSLVGLDKFDKKLAEIDFEAEKKLKSGDYDSSAVDAWVAASKKGVEAERQLEKARESAKQSLKDEKEFLAEVSAEVKKLADAKREAAKATSSLEESRNQDLAALDLSNMKGMVKLQAEYNEELRKYQESSDFQKTDDKTNQLTKQAAALQKLVFTTEALVKAAREGEDAWDGFGAGLIDVVEETKTLGELGYESAQKLTSGLKEGLTSLGSNLIYGVGDAKDEINNAYQVDLEALEENYQESIAAAEGNASELEDIAEQYNQDKFDINTQHNKDIKEAEQKLTDDLRDIWEDTWHGLTDMALDLAADQAIEVGIDYLFGGADGISDDLKDALGVDGPTGRPSDPLYVTVTNMNSGGGFSSGSSGWDFDSDGSLLEGLGSIFEMGTGWDTIATNLDTNLASSLDSMDWSATGDALAGASSDIFFDTGGTSAWDMSSYGDLFNEGVTTAWDSAISDISFADMELDTSVWDDVASYGSSALTAAAGAYAIYNGIEQGGVSGAFTATSGAYSAYNAGVDAGLYEASPYIGTAGSYLGAAGGAYSMYQGIESGNLVQTGTGAVQTYSALADMFPELANSIADSVSGMFATDVAGEVAAEMAVNEGATIAASEGTAVIAAEGAGTAAAGEGAATATGATLSSTLGFLGFAASVGMMWNESNQHEKWNLSDSWDEQISSTDTVKGWGVGEDTMTKLADDVKSAFFVDKYDYASVDTETNSMLAVALNDLGELTADLFQYNLNDDGTTNWSMMSPDGGSSRFSGEANDVAVAQMLEEGFRILYSIDEQGLEHYTMLEGQGDGELLYTEESAAYAEYLNMVSGGLQEVTDSSHILSAEMIRNAQVTTAEGEALLNSSINFTNAVDPATASMRDLAERTTVSYGAIDKFTDDLYGVTDSAQATSASLDAFYAYLGMMGQSAESFSNSVAISSTRFGDDSNYWQPTTMTEAGGIIKYHADGGILTKPTVFHIGGEAGDEAVIPLHAGPTTLEVMHNDIKSLQNQQTHITISGDEQGLRRFIKVEADKLVTSKANRNQLNERTAY